MSCLHPGKAQTTLFYIYAMTSTQKSQGPFFVVRKDYIGEKRPCNKPSCREKCYPQGQYFEYPLVSGWVEKTCKNQCCGKKGFCVPATSTPVQMFVLELVSEAGRLALQMASGWGQWGRSRPLGEQKTREPYLTPPPFPPVAEYPLWSKRRSCEDFGFKTAVSLLLATDTASQPGSGR